MEQKKTLWIIAAVGVFLIVVFGAAYLLLNNPGDKEGTTTTITPVETRNFDNGWSSPSDVSKTPLNQDNTTTDQTTPGFQTANDLFVVANNATVVDLNNGTEGTTIDLFTLGNEGNANQGANAVVTNKAPDTVVSVPNETPASNEALSYYTGKPSEAESKEKSTSVKRTSTETKKSTASSTTVSSPKTTAKTNTAVTKTNTAKAPQPKSVTRYWVQVASYQNKKTAENARTVLNDNKILSDIFTYKDNANNLFYRVRVGPYTTKSEAEYWMSKIILIKDFKNAQSYVTSTVDDK